MQVFASQLDSTELELLRRIEALEVRLSKLEQKKQPDPHSANWLTDLKANPLYQHVDFAKELENMARWKLKPANANRQITRKFVVNWLNKIDVPVLLANSRPKPPAPPPRIDPIARGQWKMVYGDPKQYGYD